MRLYPKVIPTIAREVIQTLMQDGDVEIETLRISDAEMDMASIMKEYLAAEERVNAATREALERRGYDQSRFNQVKREMADVRGFKMGDEGIEYVIGQMIEFLLISRNVEEVYAEDTVIRKKVFAIFRKHLDVDDGDRPRGARPLEAPAGGHQRLGRRVRQDGRPAAPLPRIDLIRGARALSLGRFLDGRYRSPTLAYRVTCERSDPVTRTALALVDPFSGGTDRLDGLRGRLEREGAASTEAVLVDFVEDDLALAEGALEEVRRWVAHVDRALRDPSAGRRELLEAGRDHAVGDAEALAGTLASLQRRLVRLAGHLPAPCR